MAALRLKKLLKRAYSANIFSLLLLGVGYVAYVLIGGVIFWQIEGSQVTNNIAELEQQKTKLLQVYPCLGQKGLVELGVVSYVKNIIKKNVMLNESVSPWRYLCVFIFTFIT